MAGPSSPTQSPGGNGTIDVKPSDLWSVSGRVAVQQEHLLSVGGVAVGFTETANAYTRADAAAHPKPGKTAEQRPRPAVIDKAPNFDSIPDIKWGDDDGGDDILRGLMEGIPEVVRDVLQPLCKNVFRVGRVADVHPFPQQHYLNFLCHSWMNVSVDASMGADQLTQAVGAITNHQQADWEAAMRTFCSALWGGTAWGQQRLGYQWGQTANSGPGTPRVPTGSEPVLAVLKDTADNIATILREYAEAAVDLNRDVADELHRAMWKAAKEIIEDLAKPKDPKSILGTVTSVIGKGAGLILSFDVKTVLNIDTSKLNGIVDKYTSILGGLTTRMEALKGPLDEAYLSAPKFEAGVARAHGFGTRALEEFKDSQVWLKIDSTGKYDLNLAANEYMGDGHTLEKHVGKTGEQLAQRLRDQQSNDPTAAWPHGKPGLSGSSAFPNYQRAEELTERNLNKNKVAIEAWIKGPPPASDGDVKSFYDTAPNGETSGRSVSKQPVDPSDLLSGYKQGGLNAKAYDVHGIDTRIRYDSSRTPPFTVMTSMPSKP
ncbi:RNase A-like domain-containing protein [Streptomyces sp. NPDC002917]|uniref:RNase A-like domain-containing protein n=1 Tax=Streptomyces sp. NPDC002917 TaxID=3364671 RepID=UPI0036759368